MKNTILVAGAFLLFATSMVSCKKDYICQCSKTYTSGSGGSTTDNYATYTFTENRVRAEERCNNNAFTGADIWGDYSVNCDIK